MHFTGVMGSTLLWFSLSSVGHAAQRQESATPQASGVPAAISGRDIRSRSVYLSLIRNLRKSGQVHAALAHLDSFDRQFPRSEEAALLRGECLVDVERYAQAMAVFQRLTRGPHAAAAYAGLGRVEALGERWPAAVEHYAQAVQRAPTTPAYLSDYGYALLRSGRAADAVFRLRQAAELSPGDSRARNNLILALAATGDAAAARNLLATVSDMEEKSAIEAELAKAKPANQ